ncbi:hypothetical protein [Serratia ficaria]|uniref:hypothetical protein n=1 Tax=Serratia ficaria TaxID=61651 RepID=UPI00217A88D5|nr:hypothetical protein [Serratia ficaria]CAI2081085.1 Uncharacterised protein [Serratia ficaria]
MDKLREENRKKFEEFYREEYLRGEDALTRSPVTGTYIYAHAQGHWKSWIRSRQSIVVEMITPSDAPAGLVYQIGGVGLSHDEAICEGYSAGFNEALRSIGLSIKGE